MTWLCLSREMSVELECVNNEKHNGMGVIW